MTNENNSKSFGENQLGESILMCLVFSSICGVHTSVKIKVHITL
jgi:hypothetical protein